MFDDMLYQAGRSGINKMKGLAVRYARIPGAYCFVKVDRCNGCGTCVRKGFCRVNALSVRERRAAVNEHRCRGCGRCTHLCPRGALAMEIRPPALIKDALKHIDDTISRKM